MSNSIDIAGIIRYYDGLLDKHRDEARAAGWRNAGSQASKFSEVAQIFAHEDRAFSVYDVGCGLASLYDFLKKHHRQAQYFGSDINPRMVERARRMHPGIDLECRDILRARPRRRYDYAIACGTFNVRLNISKTRWLAYVEDMLHNLYGMARRGIAVDFLSSFARGQLASEYHADPSDILSFAQRRLSPLAEIRHSSSPGHFAVFVYRAQPARTISRLRGPSLKSRSTIDSRGKNAPYR